MLKEFKAFALRGNMLDMAIGIIMGAAFGRIVTSLVQDIITPPIGLLLGNMDFSSLYINLSGTAYPSLDAAKQAGAATINYGLFLNAVVSFIIVAWAMFMLIKNMNRLRKRAEAAPAVPTKKDCPYCFSSIPIKAIRCPFCTTELKAT